MRHDDGEQIVEARCVTCNANAGSQPSELWELWADQHASRFGHTTIVGYQRVVEFRG